MLRKITVLVACVTGGGLAAVGACGGDDDGNPDARRTDARETFDAPPVDAAVTDNIATVSVLEAELRVAAGSGGIFGAGLSIRAAVIDPIEIGAPVFDTTDGTSFGCRVFEYTPAQFVASLGHDLGVLQIEAGDGTPAIPPCGFQPGAGYICPDTTASGAGAGGTVAVAGGGAMTLTDGDNTFTAAAVGRYVSITGAVNPSNNGAFPIVQLAGANTIVYANPAGVAETLPAGAMHVNVAGAGPIPSAPTGTWLEDDDSLEFTYTAANDSTIPSFTGSIGNVGDPFILDDASQGYLLAPPLDGRAFTFDCDNAADCGDGLASVVNIQTTDGSVAGLSPFAMPLPATKAVLIRCTSASGGGASVTIPAEASAFLESAGATRIQTTMVRASLVFGTTPDTMGKVTIIAGASQVGFHTVATKTLH
jgi:hypothetical protein